MQYCSTWHIFFPLHSVNILNTTTALALHVNHTWMLLPWVVCPMYCWTAASAFAGHCWHAHLRQCGNGWCLDSFMAWSTTWYVFWVVCGTICRLGSSGWPKSMYGVSKLFETSYTRILAEQLKSAGVMVNACCPGYVDTDMTSHRGVKTLEEGADTPVWLALMLPGGPSGKLFAERKQIPFWACGTGVAIAGDTRESLLALAGPTYSDAILEAIFQNRVTIASKATYLF